ncbi:aminoglycoside adenylyltransferase domain-containing protein [Saliterribacillus persicus]|uniref:Spectinomycin 9-adenylyltransferase n=1 Tax=Saliterribacillus persicus TaxID=930114 RepID=A0A368Y9E6_9BACI|nr:aminoglycoside adenylyltransferase domain-containing protein [Saliterribacillus persicus]RCW76822.1 streptomycin 3'-adenylyltransferase [Saliterribacillus persicus]
MSNNRNTYSSNIKVIITQLQKEITRIIEEDLVGFYIHGSLAMGGFNPKSSDIDLLVITNKPITIQTKRKLAKFLLMCSNSPYPVEISFLYKEQLKDWKHPCPFDFHFSEFWRERYENDLLKGTYKFLNGDINTDTDLAAHITIINNRGICVVGTPISEVFPLVPQSDYTSSIMGDFKDCLENIEDDPIYCTLNMIRVFWYLKERVISSKLEAGNWGVLTFPKELSITIEKVVNCYSNCKDAYDFEKDELLLIRNYILENIQKLLNEKRLL